MTEIRKITLNSYGEVEVETSQTGRHIKYEWYGVPKDVMLKILNCKEPTVKDITEWINKAKESHESKRGVKDAICCDNTSWWG